jgi:hypothetical protein
MAEHCYAACLLCWLSRLLSVTYKPFMLSVVTLSVTYKTFQLIVTLCVVILSVFILRVVILSVVMLSVVMLSVVKSCEKQNFNFFCPQIRIAANLSTIL